MIIPAWYLEETKYKYSYSDVVGTNVEPKRALKQPEHGPYSKDRFRGRRVGIAILCPAACSQVGQRFYRAFQQGLNAYKPFRQVYGLDCYYHPLKAIPAGLDAAAYRAAAVELTREIGSHPADLWLCFLLIEERFRTMPIPENPYYAARAVLLSQHILVQAIMDWKANKPDSDLQWVLESIGVQCYAKLGGTPWAVASADAVAEVVIGIGEARVPLAGGDERFFGFATVFNQNGVYLWTRFGQPVNGFANYVESIGERVTEAIEDYQRREKVPLKRLIVHLYKPVGKQTEAAAIENAVADLALGIEFAIVHVDHNTDFRVFDTGVSDLKPRGRLAVYIDQYQRLVVLTGSEVRRIPPRVARIRLSPRSSYQDLNALTQQVYNFTKMNWAGFQPNNVPVTTKYPAQLARKCACLEQLGGDWYSLVTDGFLLDKVWFI